MPTWHISEPDHTLAGVAGWALQSPGLTDCNGRCSWGKLIHLLSLVEIFTLQLSHTEKQHFQIKGFLWTSMKSDFSWSHCSVCKNRFYLSQCSREQGLCPSSISGSQRCENRIWRGGCRLPCNYWHNKLFTELVIQSMLTISSFHCRQTHQWSLLPSFGGQKNRSSLIPALQTEGFKGRTAGKGDIKRSGLMDQDELERANKKYFKVKRNMC